MAPVVVLFRGSKILVNDLAALPRVLACISDTSHDDYGSLHGSKSSRGSDSKETELFDIFTTCTSPRSSCGPTSVDVHTQCSSEGLVDSGIQCSGEWLAHAGRDCSTQASIATCTSSLASHTSSLISSCSCTQTDVPPGVIDTGMMTCEVVVSLEEASLIIDSKVASLTENMLGLGAQRDLLTSQLADVTQQLAQVKGQVGSLGRWADDPIPADALDEDAHSVASCSRSNDAEVISVCDVKQKKRKGKNR
eukprot:TRINITY_DN5703_c1_g1_i1.p1 TRINITY_DN5703_c1_g1~~TRINITY_DN5703_c1_g1_i1.p1  ORF type:complete len:250 (+),score=18.27 TRINITY_DN5703_c1_g1_i1:83-832(+)